MKKNVIRLITVLLSVLILIGSLPMNIFAADNTSANVAEVWVDGKLVDSSKDADIGYAMEEMWRKAISVAPEKSDEMKSEVVLKLGADWRAENGRFSTKTGFKSGAIAVPENKIISIDLNGYMIDRGLKSVTANGMVFYIDNGAELTIKDSEPSRRNSGIVEKGVWKSGDYEEGVGILGGVITGGNNITDGGAFFIEEKATLVLEGGTIAGNVAKCGAGVQLEGDSSSLKMSEKSQIAYNRVNDELYGGGAVCVDGTNVTIAGGNINSNTAKYGGGIYCYNESVTIVGVKIENNTATQDGGGIYAQETGVSISGSEIINNTAGNCGGGVFAYKGSASLSDSVVTGNTAGRNGDGIYVSENADLSISGKLMVLDNEKENLYLNGENNLSVGSMSVGSEVYLSLLELKTGLDKPFVSAKADTRPHYFYSDKEGYYIARQNDPSKANYGYLYMEEGERPVIPSEVLKNSNVNAAYGNYEGDSGTYALYKGNFEYASVLDTENNYAPVFYYSDGYFDSDPKVYNSHLATMSLNIAMSAFVKNTTNENKYLNQFAHVKQLFADIGCADEDIYVNDDYTKKPAFFGKEAERLSTIGVIIGSKPITISGESYTLVPVAVRGAGYEIEWASNGTMGKEGESWGFSDAGKQTFELIEWYIENYGLSEELKNGKIKFWVMGYSRASATANIASKNLIDKYGMNNDVYGYCFEVPQGGTDGTALKEEWTDNGGYFSIHNIVNRADFVPPLMPKEMGFKRYGVDHYVPGDAKLTTPVEAKKDYNGGTVTTYSDNKYEGYEVSHDPNSAYFKQRSLMLAQLEAVNPDLQFEDYFHEATINYVGYVVGMKDLMTEVEGKGFTQEEFINDIFFKLQDWGMSNEEIKNYREYFSTYEPWSERKWGSDKPNDLGYFNSDMTLEDAIGVVMNLIFGKSSEDADAIIDILLSSALGISAVDFNNISLLEVYLEYIRGWQDKTDAEKVEMGNKLIDAVLKERYPGAETVFDYLTEEEAEAVLDALPLIIDLLLTVVGEDYNAGVLDSSQVSVGTFAYNMNSIIMAHYPEINLAWLRSYDSHYEKDTTAYTIKADKPIAPTGILTDKELTLSAQKGSAIYYSFDGENYELYRKTMPLNESIEKIYAYTVAYGVQSDVKEMIRSEIPLASGEENEPSLPNKTGISKIIIIVLVVAIAIVVAVLIIKKKKRR